MIKINVLLVFDLQKSKKDALNFDAEFTKEEPVLTPVNSDVVRSVSYTHLDVYKRQEQENKQ